LWSTPVVFGLDDPPDAAKNIKELKKFYKVSEVGLTFMTFFKEYDFPTVKKLSLYYVNYLQIHIQFM